MVIVNWNTRDILRDCLASVARHLSAIRHEVLVVDNVPSDDATAVLIRATYTDHKKGTGIRPSASRLYVDDKNRSRAADIGKYGMHLQLKNVPNGEL